MQNVEAVDALLRWGDKNRMVEIVTRISGLEGDGDDDVTQEELAKK